MRILAPASRASFKLRFSLADVLWAAVSPWLALWIRGSWVLSPDDWPTAALYCGITCATSLIAFLIFRIREGMTSLFSVHDALEVAKAVLLSEFVTCLVLFSATRLEGIPRSTPLIHALLLAAGLIVARAAVRMIHPDRDPLAPGGSLKTEHIIVIGSNRLSALYIEFLRAYAPDHHRIIAMLDDRMEMIGRSIAGVRVLGP
jgi:FlaA1/EpsC-like NDP-sugar epimerase